MISPQTALLRLGLALALGALIGLERGRGERGAGLRTHALVALGSSLFMIVSAFGFADILGTPNVVLDPSRIAAQVASGIGFLGAGTILLRKEVIKGLTTAAAIWVTAAIGLACGGGLILEAIATTTLTLVALIALHPLRERLRRSTGRHHLRIKVTAIEESLLNRVYETCIQAGSTIEHVEVQTGSGKEKVEIECATSRALQLAKSIIALRAVPGIETISVNLHPTDSTDTPLSILGEDQLVQNTR